MNDDSSLDGGRFDAGAMGDLDPMVKQTIFFQRKSSYSFILV